MADKKIKKGDVVTVYDDYARTPKIIVETKVASSGKQWITTEYDKMKYAAHSLCSEYLGHALFLGPKEECEKFLERREKIRLMARELSQYFSMAVPDFDFTEKAYSMLEELKNKEEE